MRRQKRTRAFKCLARHLTMGLLLASLLCLNLTGAQAATTEQFLQETQTMRLENKVMRLVWWIPNEFWSKSAEGNGKSADGTKQILATVDNYVVLAVSRSELGPMGGLTNTPRGGLEKMLRVELTDGKTLTPLADKDLSPDMRNFLGMTKPMFANMLGTFGQGLELVAFPGKNEAGQRVVDPRNPGKFTVFVGADQFNWRLPLGSLMPDKVDPATKEVFLGSYIFNPYTGDRLVVKE